MSYFPIVNRSSRTVSSFATLLVCCALANASAFGQQPALAPNSSPVAMAPAALESVLSEAESDSVVPKSVLTESKVANQEKPANLPTESTAKKLAPANVQSQINNGRPYYRMINGRLVYFPNNQGTTDRMIRPAQHQSPVQSQFQQPQPNRPQVNQPPQNSPRPGLFRRLFGRR